MESLPIEDYALIGDTQTAALVGRNGSIDWLCLPHFDSDACFAALLGGSRHGRWLLAPAAAPQASSRRYRRDTLVLETEFHTAEGVVRIIDFMPPRRQEPDLIRIVEGVSGTVAMQLTTRAEFTVRAGERVPFLLMWHPSHVAAPAPLDPIEAVADTERGWHDWSARCTYQGPGDRSPRARHRPGGREGTSDRRIGPALPHM